MLEGYLQLSTAKAPAHRRPSFVLPLACRDQSRRRIQCRIYTVCNASTTTDRPAVAVGQILSLRCRGISAAGQGICTDHVGDGLIFVDRSLPGEALDARVDVVQRGLAWGTKVQTLVASPQAVVAPCSHYVSCGGCCLQDLAYQGQLDTKQQQVEHAFCRNFGLPPGSLPLSRIEGCKQQFHYRNKMTFTSSSTGLGLHDYASKDVVRPVHNCHLLDEISNCILQQAQKSKLHLHLEALTIRWAQLDLHLTSRRYMVVLHVKAAGKRRKKHQQEVEARLTPVAKTLSANVPQLVSVVVRTGSTRHEWLNSSENETLLAGQPALQQFLYGLSFKVSPASFMQTNPAQAEVLYGLVRRAAGLQPQDRVLDLFCGTGTIALVLARHCRSVIGVDGSRAAITDARSNAQLNNITNASFWVADLASQRGVATLMEQLGQVDVIVADPSRAGLDALLRQFLLSCRARSIVYVSCNPTTQARDIAELCSSKQYRLEQVQPVDMFPHTAHVESVAALRRLPR